MRKKRSQIENHKLKIEQESDIKQKEAIYAKK